MGSKPPATKHLSECLVMGLICPVINQIVARNGVDWLLTGQINPIKALAQMLGGRRLAAH